MRQMVFFILLATAVSLGGCASSIPPAVCARVPKFDFRQEFSQPPYRRQPVPRPGLADHSHSQQPAVLPLLVREEVPEPKFTSTEWWMRENARLGKAIIICQGCLPASAATASPKPAVLSAKSEPEALSNTSMIGVEGTMLKEDQP
jgi:hypothetical protein